MGRFSWLSRRIFMIKRLVTGVLAGLFLVSSVSISDYLYYHNRVYPGVRLGEIDLGGLALEEAKLRLEQTAWSLSELELMHDDGRISVISLEELGISRNQEETIKQVADSGRGLRGLKSRLDYLLNGIPLAIQVELNLNEEEMARALAKLATEIYQAPREASFEVAGEQVKIIPEQEGRYLRSGALRQQLIEAVGSGSLLSTIAVPIGRWPPALTSTRLAAYDVQNTMVKFSTTVSREIPNRIHNISLGAKAINGYLMSPGDIFSFNEAVGPAGREDGYLEAPVIIGDRLVPGVGGGLCQVSSTLYNAALLANLTILERRNHSLTVGYLPLGRDATIAYGLLDLKFANNRDHHLLIGAEMEGDQLVFRIFGPVMEERVEIQSTGQRRIDPPVHYEQSNLLPEGSKELLREGKPGYTITTWRVVFHGEREASREILFIDYYDPVPWVYRLGNATPLE